MKNNIVDNGAYIAPNTVICGDVTLEKDSNIWYGTVIRGDCGHVSIGEGTNIQDNSVIHDRTDIGKFCTVGHGAIVHGCTVGDRCLIGMGAIILNGAVIGDECIIGAGTLVLGGTEIPPRSLVVGNPCRIVRELGDEQVEDNYKNALLYIKEAKENFGE